MEARLRAKLSQGQFSSELVAVVRASSGRDFSLFAQKTDLEYDEAPTGDDVIDGWVKVDVLQRERDLCLVRLPQTTLENGQYLTVAVSQLDKAPNERPAGAAK
jgi:hypothetical protein